MERRQNGRRRCAAPTGRRPGGNMFVLTVCVTVVILIPVLALGLQFGLFGLKMGKAQDVVDATSKVVARDLARVVIRDDQFGFVSLSNHPASGTAALAMDGRSVPVVGIETWKKTIDRAEQIGKRLNNATIQQLANEDRDVWKQTVRNLNKQLAMAIADEGVSYRASRDMNGTRVTPTSDARKFIEQNLPAQVQLEDMKIELGWIESSEGPLLDNQAHLISQTQFHPYESSSRQEHICNAIKLECEFSTQAEQEAARKIQCVSYCQSCSEPDQSTPGAMTVRFTSRPVPGLLSWSEFLTPSSFLDHRVMQFVAHNGDYPSDSTSRLLQTRESGKSGTSEEYAKHLYYWLRSLHGRVTSDAVLAMMNEPFDPNPQQTYSYKVTTEGTISRSKTEDREYRRGITADGEQCTVSDTVPRGNDTAVVVFRDNVIRLGLDDAKHAGMPLDGLSLDIEIGGTRASTARDDVISMRNRTRGRRI